MLTIYAALNYLYQLKESNLNGWEDILGEELISGPRSSAEIADCQDENPT